MPKLTMGNIPTARYVPPGTEEYDRYMEAMGGEKQVQKEMKEHERKTALMNSMLRELVQDHPNKWVALTEDDEIVVARSFHALLKKVDRLGKSRRTSIVESLHPRSG